MEKSEIICVLNSSAATATLNNISHLIMHPDGWCPKIFDSILCWPATLPGTVANQSCPNNEPGHAFKECLSNGQWYRNELNKTWTNYNECTPDEFLEFFGWICVNYIIGYGISSIALAISLLIFLTLFRTTLRCMRIKIHVQLFISLILNHFISIIWYVYVVNDTRITDANPLWCQFMHLAKEYFFISSYMWMFSEALYLHLALVKVFLTDDKKTMKWFYFLGWGSSMVILLLRNFIRIFYTFDTTRCFMDETNFSSWFLSVPIAITLAFSMGFLINILRVIVLIMHPTSPTPAPESIKKAARAALILTPLFGLQFIIIPVRPDFNHQLFALHQYISMILTAYQGLCCAILFCFANQEVHQAVKRSFQRAINRQNTGLTNYPDNSGGFIPVGGANNGNSIPLLSVNNNNNKCNAIYLN